MARSRIICVALLAVLFALGVGCIFPYSDQNQYLLPGLRMKDPDFIKRDWFTWETEHHHTVFGYLVLALLHLGPIVWVTTVAHLFCSVAFALAVWLLIERFYERPLFTYAITIILILLFLKHEVLSAPVLPKAIFPTSIATMLLLLGVAMLFRKRFLIAGIFLGASALMHANYLVIIPPAVAPCYSSPNAPRSGGFCSSLCPSRLFVCRRR